MPDKCCVPSCTSNYANKSGYIPVFRFPSDESLRQTWVRKIPRKDWKPTKWSVVCIHHFQNSDVIKIDRYKDASEEWKERPMDKLKLAPGAFPTIFPALPSYLSATETKKRTNPEERRTKQSQIQDVETNILQEDIVKDFSSFRVALGAKSQLLAGWFIHSSPNSVVFYQCAFENIPKISVSVKIHSNMVCEVCVSQNILSKSEFNDILTGNMKLTRWSQLECILKKYCNIKEKEIKLSIDSALSVVKEKCNALLLQITEGNEASIQANLERQVRFMIEHLNLIFSKRKAKNYSTEYILWAFMIYMHSPSSYAAIRETSWIVLPHIKYLQHLTSVFSVSPHSMGNNEHFLKNAMRKLSERERLVCLQIDEMHIKPSIQYKSGNLLGSADNQQNTEAKTIQAFLVSSLFGSFREVVALYPVKNLTGSNLHDLVNVVIALLRKCNCHIIAIVSDNHRVNRNMFELLQDSDERYVSWDIDPPYKTFLTYDTVHILKNIRNCWINKKDAFQSLTFPDFEDPSSDVLLTAHFSDLKRMYHNSNNVSPFLKPAHKLNYKTLYPSNLERQKVSLACNVFHESTYSALRAEFESKSNIVSSEGTCYFVQIIHTWWTIVNVKSKLLGILKKNELANPFYTVEDCRLKFMKQFLVWLQHWEHKGSGLTPDTHRALFQSTSVMIQFIEYSLTILGVQFVLPGKLQTDKLEERFSCYRQLCGGNYNVSFVQVLEAEKKLRIKSLLGIKSAKYGVLKFSLETLEALSNSDVAGTDFIDVTPFLDMVQDNDLYDFQVDNSSLLYISGYASFKVSSSLDCPLCSSCLVKKEASTNNVYFDTLNRGGLAVPSELVLHMADTVCCVLRLLISTAIREDMFLKCGDQKQLLITLSKTVLFDDNAFQNDACPCGVENHEVIQKILSVITNVLLNNYSKARNDYLCNKTSESQKEVGNILKGAAEIGDFPQGCVWNGFGKKFV